jgi:hypothetical protein
MVEDPVFLEGAINLKSPYTGDWGNPNRNFALDTLVFDDGDWIYILDDDNVIHPNWYATVESKLLDSQMLKWGMMHSNGMPRKDQRPKKPVSLAKGYIDTACYMVKWEIMKKLRYQMPVHADGLMARSAAGLCRRNRPTIIFENICYHNYLTE